jgi:acyl-homoserine lactone synthase
LNGLARPDGREIDQFDKKHAVHMVYIEHGNVFGYQQVVPTTSPHLLSEVMPDLFAVEPPFGAHIWQISCHCVASGYRSDGHLVSSLVGWGLECRISSFIVAIEPSSLLPLIDLNFQPLPLGLPRKIDGQDVMAVMLGFDERTLERLREMQPLARGSRCHDLAHEHRLAVCDASYLVLA